MPSFVTPPSFVNPLSFSEGSSFQLYAPTKVYFGAGDYFYSVDLPLGVFSCSSSTFGGDPYGGVSKSCTYDSNTGTTTPTTSSTGNFELITGEQCSELITALAVCYFLKKVIDIILSMFWRS